MIGEIIIIEAKKQGIDIGDVKVLFFKELGE